MADIGIGIVGGGYMGKAHSAAFASVGTIFETRLKPRLVAICGSSPVSSARYAAAYGFARGATDWADLVNDPAVEAVIIASPQDTHRAIAEAALAHGIKDKVEAAYARSDVFVKRQKMMESWAAYLAASRGEVVKLE